MSESLFIAVDIGNTNVTYGVFAGDEIVRMTRVPVEAMRLRTGAAVDLASAGSAAAAGSSSEGLAAVSSVNPSVTDAVVRALEPAWGERLLVVRRNLPLDVPLAVVEPDKVGADRVLGALAAHKRAGGAAIVCDVGSAVTVDAIDADGVFQGGFIYPGPDLGGWALSERTAALPRVQPDPSAPVPGRNTEEAIGGGLYRGTLGAVREMAAALREAMGAGVPVYLTGGGSRRFAGALAADGWEHAPALVLEGLRHLALRKR